MSRNAVVSFLRWSLPLYVLPATDRSTDSPYLPSNRLSLIFFCVVSAASTRRVLLFILYCCCTTAIGSPKTYFEVPNISHLVIVSPLVVKSCQLTGHISQQHSYTSYYTLYNKHKKNSSYGVRHSFIHATRAAILGMYSAHEGTW